MHNTRQKGVAIPQVAPISAWFTRHGGGAWHEWIGYAALAIVVIRLVWGVVGTEPARFSNFLSGPRKTLRYAGQSLRGDEPRYIGHNPLGGLMILALLASVLVVTVSGWLYTTDRFWGIAWVEAVHSKSTDVLLVLVGVHVAGVLYAQRREPRTSPDPLIEDTAYEFREEGQRAFRLHGY